MSAEHNSADNCQVQFTVLQDGATDPVPLTVTIGVENGVMSIKASDGQDEFPGTIIFKVAGASGGMSPKGGDQCIVCDDNGKNCRVVSPCPPQG